MMRRFVGITVMLIPLALKPSTASAFFLGAWAQALDFEKWVSGDA